MPEDLSQIPRRLRRFYRKGIPIPKEIMETLSEEEKWQIMNAGQSAQKKPFSKKNRKIEPFEVKESFEGKGLFSKILGETNPAPKKRDRMLGLENTPQGETLPRSGEKIIQSGKKINPDVRETLERLKQIKNNQSPKTMEEKKWRETRQSYQQKEEQTKEDEDISSFHLTAPELPNKTKTKKENPSIPIEEKNLSPRERMEQRKREREQQKEKTDEEETEEENEEQSTIRGHYRRRGGRLEEKRETMGEGEESEAEEAELDEDDLSISDLFDSKPKKEKKKKKKEEDSENEDDLEDLEDLPLLEEE